ncbi:MAG: hypothetical protein Q4B35_06510 [Slackia sp.]|nr:hypothetical protein [Slackia sp.]
MTEQEYLGKKGVGFAMSGYVIDKMKQPNGMTQRQRERFEKEADAASKEYQAKRDAARAEYARKVASGELRQPTAVEQMMKAAKGHEDNAATQAARRALEKRGYDWRTGKKM